MLSVVSYNNQFTTIEFQVQKFSNSNPVVSSLLVVKPGLCELTNQSRLRRRLKTHRIQGVFLQLLDIKNIYILK